MPFSGILGSVLGLHAGCSIGRGGRTYGAGAGAAAVVVAVDAAAAAAAVVVVVLAVSLRFGVSSNLKPAWVVSFPFACSLAFEV